MEITHIAQRTGRFSSFLRGEMAVSGGLMNKLKWQDRLLVNGIPRHTDYGVEPGDRLTVLLDEPKPDYPAQEGALSILYEDEHILAVDKPAGILVHPSRSQFTDTLANYCRGYYEKTGQNCGFHPVTRLDRDTFGVVLVAKNAYIHSFFTQMQEKRALDKTYEALVLGIPEADRGIIDAPIARLPLPSLLRQVSPEGKPSLTEYWVMKKWGKVAKIGLRPVTGRTHQLRIHCAYRGFPILGDPQYGGEKMAEFSKSLEISHQLLCAKTIKFCHPITKEPCVVDSRMCPEKGILKCL